MKLSKLASHLREDPMWEDNHVKQYHTSVLTIADDSGQVRAAGIVASHVEDLAEDLLQRGQLCPITIDQNNVIVEGNHRYKAVETLASRYPNNPRWGMIKAYKKTFKDESERREYQLECNAHPPAKASTNDDYAQSVNTDLKQGNIKDIDWKSFNDDSDNFEKLVDYICKTYGHLGVPRNSAKAIARIAVSEAPNSKLKNYTKNEVIRGFDSLNNIGWSGKKSGDESNDLVVYATGNKSHVFPNLTGNSFKKKTNNDQLQVASIIWQSNTFGVQGKDLDTYREDMVKSINVANKSELLKCSSKLVDELYIAPQKLRKGKEDPKKFFRVKKKSNGMFDVSSIPKNGW